VFEEVGRMMRSPPERKPMASATTARLLDVFSPSQGLTGMITRTLAGADDAFEMPEALIGRAPRWPPPRPPAPKRPPPRSPPPPRPLNPPRPRPRPAPVSLFFDAMMSSRDMPRPATGSAIS